MSKVSLKGSKAETLLAKLLWNHGYRYRKNYKKLPGSPDIAILRHNIAIFVDGEFWHGKDWVVKKERLKNNREYWIRKIEENIARDSRNDILLQQIGWTPMHFWEKDVLNDTPKCITAIEDTILEQRINRIQEVELDESITLTN